MTGLAVGAAGIVYVRRPAEAAARARRRRSLFRIYWWLIVVACVVGLTFDILSRASTVP